jgi:hypothetical protein
MLKVRARSAAAVALLMVLAGQAVMAQPLPTIRRTGGVLASDLNLDGIYLARDLDSNGNALGTGEVTVFFNAANQSNLPTPAGAVFCITTNRDGTIYAANLDNLSVYQLRDLNNNGTANDPGEAVRWFNSTGNFSGISLSTPNGIAIDSVGAVYVANTPSPPTNAAAIYRFRDLDGNGDANGIDEASVWWNMDALQPQVGRTSRPFDMVFIGDTCYVLDTGASPRAIYRARDLNHNGVIDAGEFNTFILDGDFGVTISQGLATDGTSLYVVQRVNATANNTRPLFKLTDNNNSGNIDSASEVVQLWDRSKIPAPRTMATAASLAVGPENTIAVLSVGSGVASNIFMLRDVNGDGTYNGTSTSTPTDETTPFVVDAVLGTFLQTGRAIAFAGKGCPADYNQDGFQNLDDLGDFITDFYTLPPIPGGAQPNAPTYPDLAVGFAAYCPNAPDAPAPYDVNAYRQGGYRVGYSPDNTNSCPLSPDQTFPNLDNLGDYITIYYATPC